MTLEDLGNIGEFVGAIGVIVTLAYLALQIRSNTHGLRSSAVQSIADRGVQFLLTLATDVAISEILDRGYADLDSLSPEERRRFRQVIHAQMQHYESVYYHYRTGFLDEGQWLPMQRRLQYSFGRPGVRALWTGHGGDDANRLSSAHGDEFVAVCDEILRSRE